MMKRYFEGLRTLAEIKAEYKRLVKLNRPDIGGDTATIKAVEGFWANVGQLNAIVTAYAQIRRELEPITTDLCYCW